MIRRLETSFVVFTFLIKLCNACPDSCVCKWKSGKQTVECINKELLVIPEGMDSGTQVLEFSGNNLRALHREKFLKMDLINLQRIYLSRCRITSIDDRTFKGLTNLVELDLSGNLLESIPSESFVDCPSLMRLTLSSNPIKTVRRAAFSHLSILNTLELSGCAISKVEEGAFQGLYSIEWLHLNDNKLTTMRGTRSLPDSLKGAQLQGNPWECDCYLLTFHAWVEAFSIPYSAEPRCASPTRLRGRAIKSVSTEELACLPDISPTTFFLEISEGRNISLLCHVHALPEAHVSWWFQGQLLQNDTMIAPGVHILYYVEEGTVEKRSELFIFNANTDDNGTFVCNAENPAGTSRANFTIKVIVKQDPPLDINELPFELILIVMSAAAVSVLLVLFVVILSIVKCHRNEKMRKKRHNSKVTLSNSTKDSLLQENIEDYQDCLKGPSNVKSANEDDEETSLYGVHLNCGELMRAMSPTATANQVRSPSSLKRYQLEQNPDLINGTESVGRQRDCDGQHIENLSALPTVKKRVSNSFLPGEFQQSIAEFKGNDCDLYVLAPNVHLNPAGLGSGAGGAQTEQFNGNCYRTLPYNRASKRQTATNPISRYSRDAEFLCHTPHTAAYEHYNPNIRHTADGYPTRPVDTILHPMFLQSCFGHSDSGETSKVQWPSCLPGSIVRTAHDNVLRKCVGAQTQTESEASKQPINKLLHKSLSELSQIRETLAESLDEGYEGETIEHSTSAC